CGPPASSRQYQDAKMRMFEIHNAAEARNRSGGAILCDSKAETSRQSDQIISTVTTDDSTCPIIWVRRSNPRLRAHAVGMSNTPTTVISNQPGPGERGSGRAMNNTPTES